MLRMGFRSYGVSTRILQAESLVRRRKGRFLLTIRSKPWQPTRGGTGCIGLLETQAYPGAEFMHTSLIEEMDTLTLYLVPRFQPHRGVAVRLPYILRANLSLSAPFPLISAK